MLELGQSMREIEISISVGITTAEMEHVLQAACQQLGLQTGPRRMLAGYPGSLHWHVRRMGMRGTLEISFVPEPVRLWLAVHANREGEWIEDALHELPSRIELILSEARQEPG